MAAGARTKCGERKKKHDRFIKMKEAKIAATEKRIRRIRIIQGTKIKKKFKIIVYACVYALATTSGMGQWCSAVGARVEQGRQCDLFGHVRPRHVLLIISAREISA